MTHLKAKEVYMAGNKAAAWEIAKKDEGMLPHVTFDAWCAWMDTLA